MEYRIRDLEDGKVMGTLQMDPFGFQPSRTGQDRGIPDLFEGIDEAPVMETGEPPGEDGTAAESWEDPDQDVVENRVAQIITANGLAADKLG